MFKLEFGHGTLAGSKSPRRWGIEQSKVPRNPHPLPSSPLSAMGFLQGSESSRGCQTFQQATRVLMDGPLPMSITGTHKVQLLEQTTP